MDFRIKFGRSYDYKKHEMKRSVKEKIESLEMGHFKWLILYESYKILIRENLESWVESMDKRQVYKQRNLFPEFNWNAIETW